MLRVSKRTFTPLLFVVAIIFFIAFRWFLVTPFIQSPYYDFTLNVNGPDQNYFVTWATAIHNGSFTWRQLSTDDPFYIAPGYAILISVIANIPINPISVLVFIQIFISSLLLPILYLITKSLHGKVAGWMAVFFWFFYGPSIFYDACAIRASLFASLIAITTYLWVRSFIKPEKKRRWLFVALSIGLLTSLRPSVLYIAIPTLTFLYSIIKRNNQILIGSAICFIVSTLIISPFTLRNWKAVNKWIPVSAQGADALILGNDITGPGVGFSPTTHSKKILSYSQNNPLKALQAIAIDASSYPQQFIQLYARKTKSFLNNYEIGTNYSYYIYREISAFSFLGFVSWLWIISLAFIGIIKSISSKHSSTSVCLLTVLILMTLSMFIVPIQSRYRFSIAPLLIIYAAGGLNYIRMTVVRLQYFKGVLTILLMSSLLYFSKSDPSMGFYYPTGSNNVSSKNTDPIQKSDYITWIISFLTTNKTLYKPEIERLIHAGHKSYGTVFLTEFNDAVKMLYLELDSTLSESYIRKNRLRIH